MMARHDDPFPSLDSFGTSSPKTGGSGAATPGGASWGGDDSSVWDPSQARRGYTAHLPALSDLEMARRAQTPLDAQRDAALDLPLPALSRQRPGGMTGLSPAALALTARAETTDYLTVSYSQHEPGFVELYDSVIAPQWSVPFGRLLLSLFLTLPRERGWMALDVACGCGYPTLELARYLGQDCDLGGIDIWEEAILLARRKATDEWLRNVTFLTADVADSGLPEGTLDTITCNLGLPAFANPDAALAGACRLLRPGGLLLLTTPLQSTLREFLDLYYLTLRDLKLGDYQRVLSQRIGASPTREAVRRQLETAGFEVQRMITEAHSLTFPTPRAFLTSPMIQYLYLTEWRDILPDLTIRRLVFNEVERRLGARAQANGGELTMTVPMLCVAAVRA